MEHCVAIKMNKLRVCTRTWMNLKSITLSEKRQTKKSMCCMVPFIWHSRAGKANLWCWVWGCREVGDWWKGPRKNYLVWRECFISCLKYGVQSVHISQSCGCALLRWVPFSPCIFDLHVHTSTCQFINCNKCPALLSDADEAGGCACGQGAHG